MGLFGSGSPFDVDVEKATDEKNTQENWTLIMEICDRVGASSSGPKDVLKSICKRLNSAVPHVAMQALVVLDACINNCGKSFHLEVASRDMESEIKRLITKGHPKVSEKLRQLLKKWAEGEFKSDPQLSIVPSIYTSLKQEGYSFTSSDTTEKKISQTLANEAVRQEEDDLAKAIELSLKDKGGASPKQTSAGLYPTSFDSVPSSSSPVLRKVRALYDFEAAEDNELTFYAGETVNVIDASDSNWWKGSSHRGEGLFPANFVTADLTAEPEQFKIESKKSVQFSDSVQVKTVEKEPEVVEIDEQKIMKSLDLLHGADPTGERQDSPELLQLEEQVNMMGPLIDCEMDRIDRAHSQLSNLNKELVESLNLFHTLMREGPKQYPGYPPPVSTAVAMHPHQPFHSQASYPPPPPGASYIPPNTMPTSYVPVGVPMPPYIDSSTVPPLGAAAVVTSQAQPPIYFNEGVPPYGHIPQSVYPPPQQQQATTQPPPPPQSQPLL